MPPIGSSHVAPSPTGSDVIGDEAAAPVSDTPSPPATPSPPPPPPQLNLPLEEDEPYLRELHPFVPFAPYPGDPGDCLPLNTSLPQVLKQVSGKEDLNEVFDLKLRVIAREMSLQRLCCHVPNLRELSLDGSCLVSLRDLGCGLVHLEVLRIARCGLDSLDGLFGLLSLRELHAAGNLVDDVSPCTVLPEIRHIDLRGNRVSDITYVSFLSFCGSLEHLVLAECPAAACRGYRDEVRRFLPGLLTLDGEPMTPRDADAGSELNMQDDSDDEDDDFGGDGIDDWLSGGASGGPTSGEPACSRGHDPTSTSHGAGVNERGSSKHLSQKKALSFVPSTTARTVEGAAHLPPRCSSSCDEFTRTVVFKKDDVRCVSAMAGTGDGGGADAAAAAASDYARDDAPSRLTSGPPLCGDLATSLRRARKIKPWTVVNHGEREKTQLSDVGLCPETDADDIQKSSRRLHEL